MRTLPRLVALALLAVSSGVQPVIAQDLNSDLARYLIPRLGTLHVTPLPQFANGKLSACLLDFGVLIQDHIYSRGAFVLVGGSFGFMAIENGGKNTLASTLKVIVQDLDLKTGNVKPNAPESAYFVFDKFETSMKHQVAATHSDTPGSIFVIYRFDPTGDNVLRSVFDNKKIQISFARTKGGSDVSFNVDATVEKTDDNGQRTKSDTATNEFLACVKTLIDNALTP